MWNEPRSYDRLSDYERVGRLLLETYRNTGRHVNWVQPRWEYMHYHPLIREVNLDSIGVWEGSGEIVGVAHPEHAMGTVYLEIRSDSADLKEEMLRYAEENLSTRRNRVRRLRVFINDQDNGFQRTVSERGYTKGGGCEPMMHFGVPDSLPPTPLPLGFRLKSLEEENDLRKVNRLLWRGFDHGDDPPEDGIEDRRFMQSAPNFRGDLNIVAEAPNGDFVSYCGVWHEPVHQLAYLEPVATDPGYRGMGLGRATVMEGIRRCGASGARTACVGSGLPFYLSLGFRKVYNRSAWHREWSA